MRKASFLLCAFAAAVLAVPSCVIMPMNIVLLILCSLGIIILGLCACCVGVIFAEVVTNFLFVSAYLTLKENVEYTKIEEEGIVIETPEYVKDEK